VDIATLIGFIVGLSCILTTMSFGASGLLVYIHVPALITVFGGTFSATFINYPIREVLGVFSTVRNAFMHKLATPTEMIEALVGYATKARREGILTLEPELEKAKDPFLARGIRLAIDGTAPELIRDILTTELSYVESRHSLGQGILTMMGAYSPAWGMIGTLIGLIDMLRSIENPSEIGKGMSTALVCTMYGAIGANFIYLPLAGKLRTRTQQEVLVKELIIEGILSIQSGDNPRIVEHKLKAFVAPKLRK
jgi:chemotaxis protein MotA